MIPAGNIILFLYVTCHFEVLAFLTSLSTAPRCGDGKSGESPSVQHATMPRCHDGMAGIQGPMRDLHVPMLSPKCWKAAFQTPFTLNFVSIIPATRITTYNSSQAIQIIKTKKDKQRKQREMKTSESESYVVVA